MRLKNFEIKRVFTKDGKVADTELYIKLVDAKPRKVFTALSLVRYIVASTHYQFFLSICYEKNLKPDIALALSLIEILMIYYPIWRRKNPNISEHETYCALFKLLIESPFKKYMKELPKELSEEHLTVILALSKEKFDAFYEKAKKLIAKLKKRKYLSKKLRKKVKKEIAELVVTNK